MTYRWICTGLILLSVPSDKPFNYNCPVITKQKHFKAQIIKEN